MEKKQMYCTWCKKVTEHRMVVGYWECRQCITDAMEKENKYLDNLRSAQGLDLADPDQEC